jgi:hypothetical protein
MNDSYIPGLTNSMRHMAVGGRAARRLAGAQADYTNPQDYYDSLYGNMQYSPEQQAYIDSVNAYAAAQEGPFGSYKSSLPLGLPTETDLLRGNTPAGYTGDVNTINPYMQTPVEQNVNYEFNVPVDSGSGSGLVSVGYNTPIYLINPKTGEVISGGVGFDAAKQVANKARELSVGQGRKANWEIYTGAPGATDLSTFTRQAVDDPNKGVIGKIGDALKVIAPIAVQFIPAVGQALSFGAKGALGAGLGAGVGAGLARTGAGIISGDSLGESLKAGLTTGALSGLTAGALNATGADKAIGSALGGSKGAALSEAAKAGVQGGLDAAGNIVVPGITNALSSIPGAVSAGAGALSNSILSNAQNIADRLPEVQQGSTSSAPPTVDTTPIVSIGNPAANVGVGSAGALGSVVGSVPALSNGVPETVGTEDIVSEGKKLVAEDTVLPPLVPFTGDVPLAQTPKLETEVDSGLSTMDKVQLGLLAAGLLGGAAGGSGGGTIPAGLGGGRSPIFSAQLPKSNLPVSTPRTASDMGDIDYYRYGYGPEQSFFSNVPQGAPNTSTAYTGYEEREGLARGGQPRTDFAVGGPGHGRSDAIPAMLSDGEYVIDAETVALLGNGSSKAGAKALDAFRVNVRKQKGRKLAKGKFSVDAKRPEQYLKGRK